MVSEMMQTRPGCSFPVNDPAAVQLHQLCAELIFAEHSQLSGWKPRDHQFRELQRWASSRETNTPPAIVRLCWGKSDANEESPYLVIYVLYQENVSTSDISAGFCVYWHLCNATLILMKSLGSDYIRRVAPLKKNYSTSHLCCTLDTSGDDFHGVIPV